MAIKTFMLYLFTGLLSISVSARETDSAHIRALLESAVFEFHHYDVREAMDIALEAHQQALKIEHPYMIGETALLVSTSLMGLHLYQESMQYTETGIQWMQKHPDKELLYSLMVIQSIVYERLGLQKKALEQLKTIERGLVQLPKNEKYGDLAADVYIFMSDVYAALGHPDSAAMYHNKIPPLFDLMSENYRGIMAGTFYHEMGLKFLNDKHADSAYYYLGKSYEMMLPYDNYVIYRPLTGLGDYHLAQKQYDSAVYYYLQAVNIIGSTDLQDMLVEDVYKNIATAYQGIGDDIQSSYYFSKHTDMQQKNLQAQKDNIEKVTDSLRLKKEKEQRKTQKTLIVVLILIALVTISVFIIYYRIRLKNKKVSSELLEKEETVVQLNKKVNESFDDIIRMAKENDSLFWPRFQDVYPGFREKLLRINPDLKATELTLCAYIFLGFSTKEIADYTFKAEKTIRNNRHNIRKRLNLSADEDMVVWIRSLMDS